MEGVIILADLAAVCDQEVCLMSLKSLDMHCELCNALSKAYHQIIIMKRKLAGLSNSLTHLSNRPRII